MSRKLPATPVFPTKNSVDQTYKTQIGDSQCVTQLGGSPQKSPAKKLNSGLQIGNDHEDQNQTETDLTVKRLPRPSLKVTPIRTLESEGISYHERCSEVVSTPSRNIRPLPPEKLQDSHCCETSTGLCCALSRKYVCKRFSIFDICFTLTSVGIFIFDVVTDLILSLTYFHKITDDEDFRFFFGLTLGLVVGPSFVVQCFSCFWVFDDYRGREELERERKEKESAETSANGADSVKAAAKNSNYVRDTAKDTFVLFISLIIHIFQAAILYRYIRVLIYGIKSRYYEVKKKEAHRDHFDTLWRYEVHDVNMLRLLESFLESAPQLALQIYIMLATKQTELIIVISCVGSLLALSTMMVSIQRAIRNSNPKKAQLSIPASLIMFFWRAFTISSRVLAFALFLTIQPLAFLVFILTHWALATAWIAIKGTNFCRKKAAEYFFDGICGVIYIFCFFNVHEEKNGRNSRSRCRMLVFYLVVIAENSILSILWFFFRPGGDTRPLTFTTGIWQTDADESTKQELSPAKNVRVIDPAGALTLILAVHVLFLLGIAFMLLYYAFLHPRKTGPACCCPIPRHRPSVDECGTELVSAVAEQMTSQEGEIVHADQARAHSQTSQSRATRSRENLCLQAQEASRPAMELPAIPESDDDSETGDLKDPLWSQTVFNRGKRARKIYSKQYSREKSLDSGKVVAGEQSIQEQVPVAAFSPRQADRFIAVASQPSAKSSAAGTSKPTSASAITWKKPQSVVIKPGSQVTRTNVATRSATHQGLRSHTLPSPARKSSSRSRKYSRRRDLGALGGKSYSASMSCLTAEKPRSYAARKMQALDREGPCASSFTINENEVVECMESSV